MVLTREKMQYALKSNLEIQMQISIQLRQQITGDGWDDDMMTPLSAMAPDTIVVAVVAKDIWKMSEVKVGPILTSDQSEASVWPRVDQSQLT